MITHDLGVVADIADEVHGHVRRPGGGAGDRRDLFYRPHHPYTKGLLESIPQLGRRGDRLKPIPGQPPSLINLPTGCSFHPRCAYVMDRCLTEEPPLRRRSPATTGDHGSACWLPARRPGSARGRGAARQAVREGDDRHGEASPRSTRPMADSGRTDERSAP